MSNADLSAQLSQHPLDTHELGDDDHQLNSNSSFATIGPRRHKVVLSQEAMARAYQIGVATQTTKTNQASKVLLTTGPPTKQYLYDSNMGAAKRRVPSKFEPRLTIRQAQVRAAAARQLHGRPGQQKVPLRLIHGGGKAPNGQSPGAHKAAPVEVMANVKVIGSNTGATHNRHEPADKALGGALVTQSVRLTRGLLNRSLAGREPDARDSDRETRLQTQPHFNAATLGLLSTSQILPQRSEWETRDAD